MSKAKVLSLLPPLFAGALLAIAGVACGGSVTAGPSDDQGMGGAGGGGGSANGPKYTLDEVCEHMASQLCATAKPCCTSSDIGFDEAGCRASARADCDTQVRLAKEGKRVFDPEAVDACLSARTALLDKCAVTVDELLALERSSLPCGRIFTGSVEEGGACEEGSDCKQPSGAKEFAACHDKRCVIGHVDRGEGDACGKHKHCAEGLRCDGEPVDSSGTPTCRKPKRAGEGCTPSAFNSFECEGGLYCDYKKSVCVTAKDLGQSCGSYVECTSRNCQEGECVEAETLRAVDTRLCKGVED